MPDTNAKATALRELAEETAGKNLSPYIIRIICDEEQSFLEVL